MPMTLQPAPVAADGRSDLGIYPSALDKASSLSGQLSKDLSSSSPSISTSRFHLCCCRASRNASPRMQKQLTRSIVSTSGAGRADSATFGRVETLRLRLHSSLRRGRRRSFEFSFLLRKRSDVPQIARRIMQEELPSPVASLDLTDTGTGVPIDDSRVNQLRTL